MCRFDQAVIATVATLRKCPTLNMARRFREVVKQTILTSSLPWRMGLATLLNLACGFRGVCAAGLEVVSGENSELMF